VHNELANLAPYYCDPLRLFEDEVQDHDGNNELALQSQHKARKAAKMADQRVLEEL
jgi:hypothetical protein